jgi:hypothetical protein
MNFTINGEPYTFTLEVDGLNRLTGFTATNQSTTYDCAIHMTSQLDEPELVCCTPSGCTQGGCGSS